MVSVFSKDCYVCFLKETVNYLLDNKDNLLEIKKSFLSYIDKDEEKFNTFSKRLPIIKEELKDDLDFFMISDPAINSKEEVIWSYPGYRAITCYRIAHSLYSDDLFIQARMISELAHSLTGIDIHPGAKIASPFFIDHGTGIVIGQTSIINRYVKLYQGVTLGALSLADAQKMKNVKRHPTIGNHVTIYSCASILGDITIGDNVTIGANVFLIESVGPNMKVTIGKPSLTFSEKK